MDEEDLEDLRTDIRHGQSGSVMALIVKDDDDTDTLTGIITNLLV